jgi:hypothetical protein
MEPTLQQSLDVVFGRAQSTLPTAQPGGTIPQAPGASGTPVPGPTPAATPRVTASPVPAATPSSSASVNDLARQADAAYQRAQAALRNGDFATYGQEIATVEALIRQIVERSGTP